MPSNSPFDARGKVVVVTGGGSGIGEAIVKRLAREGARACVVVDIDDGNIARVVKDLRQASPVLAVGKRCDVASEGEVAALLDQVEAEVGPISLFVCNAGIGPSLEGAVGVDVPPSEWSRMMGVNFQQTASVARHLIPLYIERGAGHLMVTASAAGLLTQIGSVTYAVSKAAAVSISEWLSVTYGDLGVGVSCLCPQAVSTPMTASSPDSVASVDGMLEPEDVAEATVEGLRSGSFLILPHPKVAEYALRKATDRDRWILGM